MNAPAPGRDPARVIVDEEGHAVNAMEARYEHLEWDVVFLRDDGWTLGAPQHLERVAYETWRGEWIHFARKPWRRWIAIKKYAGGVQ